MSLAGLAVVCNLFHFLLSIAVNESWGSSFVFHVPACHHSAGVKWLDGE